MSKFLIGFLIAVGIGLVVWFDDLRIKNAYNDGHAAATISCVEGIAEAQRTIRGWRQ